MTSRELRALCGCGHRRGEHRALPQEHACPVEGCTCTGYHAPGESMPAPVPPKVEPPPRRVVEIGEPGRRGGGRLGLLLAMSSLLTAPLPREDEGPPTCLCGGTRGRHRPNCHTLDEGGS